MISAAIEPPSPPVARAPAQRPGAKGREASGFDEALRDQESAALDVETDDVLATDAAPPAPVDAPVPLPPAPVALDTLIAQVLPPPPPPQQQQQQQPPQPTQQVAPPEQRKALALSVSSPPSRPETTTGGTKDSAPESDAAATEAPKTPGQTFRVARDESDAQESPSQDTQSRGASAFTPASGAPSPGDANGRKVGHDDESAPQVRNVAVRKVAAANHFPVTADPVRQIAAHVVRALDAPAAPAAPDVAPRPVKTISVTLEPESLGTVTLRMRLSGNHLSVRVDVAEPATLEMIQRDRDRLQKSMTSDNVSIDRLEIHAAKEALPVQGGDNANAPKQDMNAPGQQSRQNGAAAGGEQRGGSRSQPQPQPQQQQTRMNGQDNDSPRGSDSRNLYL